MKVVIVGGGTAGWLMAARLATSKNVPQDVSIVLVEAPDISTVGVGEGTWPSMRQTLKKIGIDETDFLRRCSASFKQGTHFKNWSSEGGSEYCHPFDAPKIDDIVNVGEYWQNHATDRGVSFENSVSLQASLRTAKLAPKTIGTPNYQGHLNYGYHLDAGEFAGLLRDRCDECGNVKHVLGRVENVIQFESGDIKHIELGTRRDFRG